MDLQFWLYLIIGVIYFLSRVLKKQEPEPEKELPRKKPEQYRGEVISQQPEKPKALTFEELLKEITEAKQPPKPVYQPQKQSEYVDYDDNIPEEEQDLETIETDYRKKDKLYNDVYEEAKRQAFVRPSLEETLKLKDTDVQFGKFKVFEQTKPNDLLEGYSKDLQDPEGLKKAFVLSEILNRKF